MTIPDYQSIMYPLLKLLEDGKEHSLRDCIEILADQFGLSQEERKQLLPSGRQPIFENRVGWARTYLKKAGIVAYPKRGFVQITERGQQVLQSGIDKIDNKFLQQYEGFQEFQSTKRKEANDIVTNDSEERDPVEQIEVAYSRYLDSLVEELLTILRDTDKITPRFFERLVVQVLVSMGYGGGYKEAAKVAGRSGDEGIDGVINQDKLGLDVIYIQAKRWSNPVGRPEIQKFVGALHGQQANKGVFITTSTFTSEAENYAEKVGSKIILINGKKLAELMIEHNVGVYVTSLYELKSIDTDFFEIP